MSAVPLKIYTIPLAGPKAPDEVASDHRCFFAGPLALSTFGPVVAGPA